MFSSFVCGVKCSARTWSLPSKRRGARLPVGCCAQPSSGQGMLLPAEGERPQPAGGQECWAWVLGLAGARDIQQRNILRSCSSDQAVTGPTERADWDFTALGCLRQLQGLYVVSTHRLPSIQAARPCCLPRGAALIIKAKDRYCQAADSLLPGHSVSSELAAAFQVPESDQSNACRGSKRFPISWFRLFLHALLCICQEGEELRPLDMLRVFHQVQGTVLNWTSWSVLKLNVQEGSAGDLVISVQTSLVSSYLESFQCLQSWSGELNPFIAGMWKILKPLCMRAWGDPRLFIFCVWVQDTFPQKQTHFFPCVPVCVCVFLHYSWAEAPGVSVLGCREIASRNALL